MTVNCQSFVISQSIYSVWSSVNPSLSVVCLIICLLLVFFYSVLLPIFLSVYFFYSGVPGKPVITGFEDPVQDGGSVTLTCTSTGSKPPAQLHWYKGQEKLDGTHIYILENSTTYLHGITNAYCWVGLEIKLLPLQGS